MRCYRRRLTVLLTLTICLSVLLMACQTPTATAVATSTAEPLPTATPPPAPTEPAATPSPAAAATPLAGVATPPTQDVAFQAETALPADFPAMDLLLADGEGRLVLYHLPTGDPTPLTDAGVFRPGMARPLWTPPRRSPDGAYWLLPQPDGLGTWLVSPQEALARKIDDRDLNTAWAPTGDRFVCAWESDHFIFDVHGVSPDDGPEYVALRGAVMGREGETILALAWSPVANQTALLVKSPDVGTAGPALKVLLSGPIGGAIRSLGTVPVKAGESTAFDLAWSPDGERWASSATWRPRMQPACFYLWTGVNPNGCPCPTCPRTWRSPGTGTHSPRAQGPCRRCARRMAAGSYGARPARNG